MRYTEILQRFENVKTNDKHKATARCPAHEDTHNSLSIDKGQDGRVLIHCHAGCTIESIVSTLGLRMHNLFQPLNGTSPNSRGRSESTYDYHDESGNLAFQVVRFKPKEFRQRRPNGNGGWIWNMNGIEPVLYRLPELRQSSPDDWVFVVEGEKDVDRLRSHGLIATCNPMGAGKWREYYTRWLSGRRICIVPDNDEPGRSHAAQVADSVHVVAETVRITELPGLPKKGDVSDWFDNGGDAADLVELANRAPAYKPSTGELTLSEMIEQDLATWSYAFSEDETDGTIYVNGEPIDGAIRAEIHLAARDSDYGKRGKPLKAVDETILVLARRNRFHPVRDWLVGLQWDGQNHFQHLQSHFADKHTPITYDTGKRSSVFAAFLYRWLLGCVACAHGDATVQNPMLVIGGDQGLGKSYFAHWLCSPLPKMFVEQHIDPHSADHARLLATRWIWEVGELGSTVRRADREALKRFITQTTVTFRVPYAKDPVVKPVLASFLGTLNNEVGFLTDPTGSRRFLSVELDAIDRKYSDSTNIVQLWAQLAAAYANGESCQLIAAELSMQHELNESNYITSDTREAILKYFALDPGNKDMWTFTVDIVQYLQSMGIKSNATSVGIELRRELGMTSLQRQVDGRRGKGFYGIRQL